MLNKTQRLKPQHAFGRKAARCGSQLPTAISPHRAYGSLNAEVKNAFGSFAGASRDRLQ